MQDEEFVGRETQLAELDQYLAKAMSGQGQVCFVTGQAGSGKTVLVRHFLQRAMERYPELLVTMGSCNAQTGIGDPYLPFREALDLLTGNTTGSQVALRLSGEGSRRLQTTMVRSVQVLVEVAPELIDVLVPGVKLVAQVGKAMAKKSGWVDQLDELARRRTAGTRSTTDQSRIFEQYSAFLLQLSQKVPIILFLDDLQWADTASIGLLFHLGRRLDSGRILILGTYRANDVALGRAGARHPLEPVVHELTTARGDITVDLDSISEIVGRDFVDALVDLEPNVLDHSFRAELYHRTGGHALFTVELLRAMKERGALAQDSQGRWAVTTSLDWNALPAKVEGVIAERIARLSDELKEMLIVGSVEGEQFTAEVLARVQAVNEREVIRALSNNLQKQHHLVGAMGMVRLGSLRLSLYHFMHSLVQQYLYGSLGPGERASLHRDLGQALETLFAGETDPVSAQLARHFEEGGNLAKAAVYRLQAGKRAHRMSAHFEATTHFTRGLELLAKLPQSAETIQLQLATQTALGTTLIATHGYASPAVEAAYKTARDLCRALGDPPDVIPVLYGLALFWFVRGELSQAQQAAADLATLAHKAGNQGYEIGCQVLLGACAMYMGRPEQARNLLEQAISSYDRERHRDLAYQQGQDPFVAALSYLSWALWLLGYPDLAVERSREALSLASALQHPYSTGLATVFSAKLHEFRQDWDQCQAQAQATLALAQQGGFALWRAMATMINAYALAHRGQVGEALVGLQQGLAGLKATGALLSVPYFGARLAEVFLLLGRRDEGLAALADGFSMAEQVWWKPERDRVQGELLLLAAGAEDRAVEHLRAAVALAESQGSKALALRALMSLTRLLDGKGDSVEMRERLYACLSSFTEGYQTGDLVEAVRLLSQDPSVPTAQMQEADAPTRASSGHS